MKRNKIRLTESQLHRVIKESVKRVLREGQNGEYVYTREDLINAVANDTSFWQFEFDYNESRDWLPKNFSRMSDHERAECIISYAPGWDENDFGQRYFGDGYWDDELGAYIVED